MLRFSLENMVKYFKKSFKILTNVRKIKQVKNATEFEVIGCSLQVAGRFMVQHLMLNRLLTFMGFFISRIYCFFCVY